ncbi:MAG: transglycosylase SLT domain-containing protein [Pyrinomonadaceae bacterium]
MITSFPRLLTRIAFLVALAATPFVATSAQITGSSARAIPTAVERDDPHVTQTIDKAERHYKQGLLNLSDNKREQARDEFDKAVDAILESGLDVRANRRLQTYYLELIEQIYRLEVPQAGAQVNTALAQTQQQQEPSGSSATAKNEQQQQPSQQQIGFRDQKFEPSPLDELSKLQLTPEEQNVNPQDLDALENAKNAVDFGFQINPLIQQFINYYQGRGRSTMESGLRRSGRYMRMARKIFREEGVPEDIVWLGQVESAWRPTAMSWAAASGLWQFVPSTGREYGLRQTAWIDERNSFEKATRASARYLKSLAARYNGNWELAMGAYNTGALNIDRGISRAGAANFWKIYPYIANETRNYVPNILATILIAKNPEKYGFHGIRPETPMGYDIVKVPNATSLQLIADATDTNVDYLRSINPELRRDVTPRGEAYDVRVPAGKAKQFVAILKRVPGDRRESARIISVAPGEDLNAVAQRTGTNVEVLKAMNGAADGKAIGNKVVVPNSNVRLTSYVRAKNAAAPAEANSGPRKVKAMGGDTIAKIAERYHVSADEVAKLNGMATDSQLTAGQEVRVPASANAPAPSRRGRR